MILRSAHLSAAPAVFRSMTGLTVEAVDDLLDDLRPRLAEAQRARLSRPDRRRAIGGGHPFELTPRDQLLMTVVRLRRDPTRDVLAYLLGVSKPTVTRTPGRLIPLLEAAGRDSMRMPDPGRGRRKPLDVLLRATPELAVIIDTFEQRVQRPRGARAADAPSSGKKKQPTLKVRVAVDEQAGRVVDVADSVPGPTADIKVLEGSGLLGRLPAGVGALGDLADVGIEKLHPAGLGATPRRKPRGRPRPPEDGTFNSVSSRRRVLVEHGIGRMRRYQSLTQTDRHHRRGHSARVRAVAGRVNRQLDHLAQAS